MKLVQGECKLPNNIFLGLLSIYFSWLSNWQLPKLRRQNQKRIFDIIVFVDGEDVNYCMAVRQRGY